MRDLSAAETAEAGLPRWFRNVWLAEPQPLAADVWVFTADFERILVVEHRWRGLVPPGGKVEPGETPREGAVRELAEETGLVLRVSDAPAFAAARSYGHNWPATLNLSYWAVADPAAELVPEVGQPARWVDVRSAWRTYHRGDAEVVVRFAETKRQGNQPA